MAASTATGSCSSTTTGPETNKEYGCPAEEMVDAQLLSRGETLRVIETLTLKFLQAISKEEDPELYLVCKTHIINMIHNIYVLIIINDNLFFKASRSEKNVVRDEQGRVHLGTSKTVKKLFGRGGTGVDRYTKSQFCIVSRRMRAGYIVVVCF